MAPLRATQSSTSVAGPSKEKSRKKSRNHSYSNNQRQPLREDALPGVQKLKSSIRQAKRLLAKDSLAADVQVETGRRLRALEADLARAEESRKERHYATKYHRVKFFERQKIVRKISQTKRRMVVSEGKEKEKLQSALADLRVDLNYVLHFPKTKKYISLFPPDVRGSGFTAEPVTASSDDNEDRTKVREMIQQQMRCGELSSEPENELGKPGPEDRQVVSRKRGTAGAISSMKVETHSDAVKGDDFFGDDEDEDEDEDSARRSI